MGFSTSMPCRSHVVDVLPTSVRSTSNSLVLTFCIHSTKGGGGHEPPRWIRVLVKGDRQPLGPHWALRKLSFVERILRLNLPAEPLALPNSLSPLLDTLRLNPEEPGAAH